jgi:hypothetical protein
MNIPTEKIRKDDLEVLGDLVEYVGGGLTRTIQSTVPGDRRNLFKNGNLNPRDVLSKALGKENLLSSPNISKQSPSLSPTQVQLTHHEEANLSHSALPLTNEQLTSLMRETYSSEEKVTSGASGASLNTAEELNNKFQKEQMEFNFIQQIVHPFGSVGDIIQHFEEKLNNLEQSIKLICTFMVETRETMQYVKNNMQRKRKTSQNTI